MSSITTAFDNFKTRVAAVLTSGNSWTQIPNAYDIPSNPDIFLKQGYAIGIGSGVNANRLLSNYMSIDRQFTLSISREAFKLESDVDGFANINKQIYEDLKLVIADLETNTTLNNGLIFAGFEGDSGIQAIKRDNFSFLFVTATFTIKYMEVL